MSITRRQALRQLALALVVGPAAARAALRAAPVSVTPRWVIPDGLCDYPKDADRFKRLPTRTVGPIQERVYEDCHFEVYTSEVKLLTVDHLDGSSDRFIHYPGSETYAPWVRRLVNGESIETQPWTITFMMPRCSVQLSPRFPNLDEEPRVMKTPCRVQWREVTWS